MYLDHLYFKAWNTALWKLVAISYPDMGHCMTTSTVTLVEYHHPELNWFEEGCRYIYMLVPSNYSVDQIALLNYTQTK